MKTADEVRKEFLAKLKALLNEYGAVIVASDHYQGYPECGEDIRATVEIPGIWDKETYECVREQTDIDLGFYFDGQP